MVITLSQLTLLGKSLLLPLPLVARRTAYLLLTTELVICEVCIYSFPIGKTYELPIKDGAINATDLSKIKDEKGEVTISYDPAYMNTVACVRTL